MHVSFAVASECAVHIGSVAATQGVARRVFLECCKRMLMYAKYMQEKRRVTRLLRLHR